MIRTTNKSCTDDKTGKQNDVNFMKEKMHIAQLSVHSIESRDGKKTVVASLIIGSFFNDSLAPCFYNCFLYLKTWGEHIGLVIITNKMAFLPELRQYLNILVPIFDIDIHLNFIHNQNLDFIRHGLNLVQSHSALWENKNILNW